MVESVAPAPEQVETAPIVGGCEQYRPLVSQYDWDVSTVLRIMKAESGCIPDRDNSGLNRDGTNDVGLLQINSIHVTSGLITNEGRKDPTTNIDVAYQLYRGAGYAFTPWSAYNSGKHLNY